MESAHRTKQHDTEFCGFIASTLVSKSPNRWPPNTPLAPLFRSARSRRRRAAWRQARPGCVPRRRRRSGGRRCAAGAAGRRWRPRSLRSTAGSGPRTPPKFLQLPRICSYKKMRPQHKSSFGGVCVRLCVGAGLGGGGAQRHVGKLSIMTAVPISNNIMHENEA